MISYVSGYCRATRTMDCIYSKMKDKLCKWDLAYVIYAIKCITCPKKREYIGKTQQCLGSKKKQHLSIATKMKKLMEQESNLKQESDASLIINCFLFKSCFCLSSINRPFFCQTILILLYVSIRFKIAQQKITSVKKGEITVRITDFEIP